MATRQEITHLVIEKLQLLGKPNVSPLDSPAEYARMVNLYVETLEAFDLETVKAGMLLMQKDWMGSKWPAPGKLHHYFTEAERERQESLPREPLPRLPDRQISREERERVQAQMARLLVLMKSGRNMAHEQAYDAVYLEEPHPGHKAERLRSIEQRAEADEYMRRTAG